MIRQGGGGGGGGPYYDLLEDHIFTNIIPRKTQCDIKRCNTMAMRTIIRRNNFDFKY